MANLREIMDGIQTAMRHGVNVKAERVELIRRINRHQRRICAAKHWSWLQQLQQVRLKTELTVSTWSSTTSDYALTFTLPTGWSATKDVSSLEGAVVTFSDTLTDLSYIIERATISSTTITIFLDPRFVGVSGGSMTGNEIITIKFLRYALPGDMSDVYEFMLREDDSGPIHELTLDQEAWFMLNDDDPTGTPSAFMLSPNRPREHPDPEDNYGQTSIPAPVDPPTLASGSASGGFAAGDKYEYGYCWVYAGMVGPMSPTAEVEVDAGDDTITVSAIEKWGAAPGTEYGRKKYIFRRKVYSDRFGPWYRIATQDSYATSYQDTATFDPLVAAGLHQTIKHFPVGNMRRWVRFYPLTNEDRVVELRYLSRIPDLHADTDVPFIPDFAHDLLMHEVVREIAAESDAPAVAKDHERQAKELRKYLSRRETGSAATFFRKSSVFSNGRPGLRFGQAVWNG